MAEIDILSINNKKIQDVEARKDIKTIKENQINLVEDDTSMEGISDSVYDTLTTKDKTIIGGINELNSQFKDIANKTIIEDGKIYLVKEDGTKLDEGTDLPISSGTDTSNNIETYKCEDIGEVFSAPSDYIAWCPNNIIYDKDTNQYVAILNCADKHASTKIDRYLCKINANTFVVEDLYSIEDKIKDASGNSVKLAFKYNATTSLILQDDNSYMFFSCVKDSGGNDTEERCRIVSTDKGKTWTKKELTTNIKYHPWAFYKLSNGRLIGGYDYSKSGMSYSDDNGITWTQVIPTTCGGEYEAEPCILELEPNKLIAIARYSMSGIGVNSSGDSEHAVISYSNDNGTTWTSWQISNTIDNMNAASCCGIVHDGIVEIFTCSRWYNKNGNSCTDYTNTGKSGAIIHYTATIENVLNDNFTKIGIIDYAKGNNPEDYHAPAISKDKDNNILIMHMDKGLNNTCTQRFIRGSKNLSYRCNDTDITKVFPYSSYYTNVLFNNMLEKVNSLQYALSKINGSEVGTPTGHILTNKYIASDMYSSNIYPWQKGSDFYNKSVANYDSNTGTGNVHEFLDNNNDGKYETLKTYSLAIKENLDSTVKDSYLSFKYYDEISVFYSHIIKDGYITVLDRKGAYNIVNYKEEKVITGDLKTTEIQLFDGYCLLNGIKYDLPKIPIDDYIALDNDSVARHKTITNLIAAPSTTLEVNDKTDQIGIFFNQYAKIEYVKIYKKFN